MTAPMVSRPVPAHRPDATRLASVANRCLDTAESVRRMGPGISSLDVAQMYRLDGAPRGALQTDVVACAHSTVIAEERTAAPSTSPRSPASSETVREVECPGGELWLAPPLPLSIWTMLVPYLRCTVCEERPALLCSTGQIICYNCPDCFSQKCFGEEELCAKSRRR